MTKRILTALLIAGVACAVIAFSVAPSAAQDKAKGYKNLQVIPKDIDKKTLKKRMKAIAKATGKTCEDCHDTDDFSKDSKLKKQARKMMKMTAAINKELKKAKVKGKVDCITCHAGKEKPAK